ncbi:MAG: hypothetical protein AAFU34_15535 [Pseudomonadota bacterium]
MARTPKTSKSAEDAVAVPEETTLAQNSADLSDAQDSATTPEPASDDRAPNGAEDVEDLKVKLLNAQLDHALDQLSKVDDILQSGMGELPVIALLAGFRVRRRSWAEGCYIRQGDPIAGRPNIRHYVDSQRGERPWEPKDLSWLLARDWEVVPE